MYKNMSSGFFDAGYFEGSAQIILHPATPIGAQIQHPYIKL